MTALRSGLGVELGSGGTSGVALVALLFVLRDLACDTPCDTRCSANAVRHGSHVEGQPATGTNKRERTTPKAIHVILVPTAEEPFAHASQGVAARDMQDRQTNKLCPKKMMDELCSIIVFKCVMNLFKCD